MNNWGFEWKTFEELSVKPCLCTRAHPTCSFPFDLFRPRSHRSGAIFFLEFHFETILQSLFMWFAIFLETRRFMLSGLYCYIFDVDFLLSIFHPGTRNLELSGDPFSRHPHGTIITSKTISGAAFCFFVFSFCHRFPQLAKLCFRRLVKL